MPVNIEVDLAAIFVSAISKPEGVFALLACVLGVLAWVLFGRENWRIKLLAFAINFAGLATIGYFMFQANLQLTQQAQQESAAQQQIDQQRKQAEAAQQLQHRLTQCQQRLLAEFEARQTLEVRNAVRCEGGGLTGRSDHRIGAVAFDAPPGFVLVGAAEIVDSKFNHGQIGALAYLPEGSEPRSVRLSISCTSPARVGGPGAWAEATIRVSIKRQATEADHERFRLQCATQ